ncbi:MAG TPA: dipeptidase PepE [Casimicrobiaceae bacterium]|nr:dipeptidase PepE [Casimicrobiaceae bacterium]
MEILLLSNSTSDNGFLVDWIDLLRDFTAGCRNALFVPYASVTHSWESYEARVVDALAPIDIAITSIHRASDAQKAVLHAESIIVGGGNTFHLLHHCRKGSLLKTIAQRVRAGMRYVGWSAGANIACPTIRTTNDMPVIDPGGFEALDLVPFQINPHFTDEIPAGHRGETRSERLNEFVALNQDVSVLALPEGCYVRASGDTLRYGGIREAKWMRHGYEPVAVTSGPLVIPA